MLVEISAGFERMPLGIVKGTEIHSIVKKS